jgi:hypothetical protein
MNARATTAPDQLDRFRDMLHILGAGIVRTAPSAVSAPAATAYASAGIGISSLER